MAADIPSPSMRRKSNLVFWLMALALLLGMLSVSRDYGVTFDELLQNEYGRRVLAYYTSHFEDRSFGTYSNLYYYGGLFDLMAALLVKSQIFSATMYARHFLNAIFGWLAMLFTGLIAKRIAGPKAGVLALALMLANPIFLGHSMNNPKDIPFATFFTMTLYALLAIRPRYPYYRGKDMALVIIAIALALNIRVGAMMLLAHYALFMGLAYLHDRGLWSWKINEGEARKIGGLAWRVGLVALLAIPLGTIFWPWAHAQPYLRPFQALHKFSHFADWNFPVLFQGEWPRAANLPWHYIFTHIIIQMPPVLLIGVIIAGGLLAWRPYPHRGALALVFAFLAVPCLYVLVSKPILYDGMRHFLFVIPPLVVLASLGLYHVAAMAWQRGPWPGIVCSLLLLGALSEPLVFAWRWHPYQSVYFSPLIGGPRRAFKNYEMDFWGTCVGESLRWVDQQASPQPRRRTVVAISMWPFWEFYREIFPKLQYNDDKGTGDYKVIVMRNRPQTLQQQLNDAAVRHKIEVDGAPLCLVMEGKHQIVGEPLDEPLSHQP